MKNKNFINIGCACNNGYAQHAGVMLYSLLKNCSSPNQVRIFLVDSGISHENKKKIDEVVKRFDAKINYIKPKKELINDLKICRHLSLAAYYRFSLIDNPQINKLLYLDADLVILKDIKKLFDINFKKNIVFAVKDPCIPKIKKEELGIMSKSPYFNSGVLLINCKKWRSNRITEKTLNYIRENPDKIDYADQDGLNAVLRDFWEEINPSWNVITKVFYYIYTPFSKIQDYNKKEIKEIIRKPKIIHYASFMKPWKFLDIVPYKKIYWSYLRMTPWKSYKYPDKSVYGIFNRFFEYVKWGYDNL